MDNTNTKCKCFEGKDMNETVTFSDLDDYFGKLVDFVYEKVKKEMEEQSRSRFQAICDGIDAGLKENL